MPAELHDLEVVGGEAGECGVEDSVVPAGIVRAADIHVRAIVRHDQAVSLHCAEDLLCLRREAGEIDAGLEPKPGSHRQCLRVGASRVRRRVDVPVGRANRDAKSMVDLARAEHLVVPHESRENRQARGVGGCPAVWPAVVSRLVEEGAGACVPGRAVEEDVVQLVQMPVVAVDDDQVAIGLAAKVDVGRRPAFNPMRLGGRLHRNRIERVTPAGCVVDAVAFTPIQERHADLWLGAVNHDVREAVRVDAARGNVAAEVGMQAPAAAVVDERHESRRACVDRRGGDLGVPPIIGGEERKRARENAARLRRRKGCRGKGAGEGKREQGADPGAGRARRHQGIGSNPRALMSCGDSGRESPIAAACPWRRRRLWRLIRRECNRLGWTPSTPLTPSTLSPT